MTLSLRGEFHGPIPEGVALPFRSRSWRPMKTSKFSEAHIVRIPQEALSGKTVAEVCRENGVRQNTYTVWLTP